MMDAMDAFDKFFDKIDPIVDHDDSEALVKLFHECPETVAIHGVGYCAMRRAKKCLTALVSGKVCEPPPARPGCATSIHEVAWFFPDPDVIDIMLMRGAIMDMNIKDYGAYCCGTPLQLALDALSSEIHLQTLNSWSPGDSIFKLIILLCQWEMKHRLDAARLFASHDHSVREMAGTFLRDGKLMQLAALLLIAREQVMVPNETGLTIQQDIIKMIDDLGSEADLNHERARYKSFLVDACKLFDVFQRAGDALSFYCKSMCKQIPTKKVLVDVVGILKEAGFLLQFEDLDLRDCYRGCRELWFPNLYKLSDSPGQNNKYMSLPYPTETLGSGTTVPKFPSRHWDPLLGRFKVGQVLPLASPLTRPQLLSTAAIDQTCRRSSTAVLKYSAYVAMQLKRGIVRCL